MTHNRTCWLRQPPCGEKKEFKSPGTQVSLLKNQSK
jgi:hypothetical protein